MMVFSDRAIEGMMLEDLFRELAAHGSVPQVRWPADVPLENYGLRRRGGRVEPGIPFEPLDAQRIEAALSAAARAWLVGLEVHPVIGSTNTELMGRASHGAIGGTACLAEVQLQGRGRRGRGWSSPFGGAVALSLGIDMTRPAAELGGASLVVGLAVLDALESLGVTGAGLKWPNDLLIGEAKLGGILIEMASAPQGVSLVVGVGINVRLAPGAHQTIDRLVADLAPYGPPERNMLAARILSTVVSFLHGFDETGFAPFREAFMARHRYQGRACRIVQGARATAGQVVGVSNQGGLLLETPAGIEEFQGGEVSLRADDHRPA